MLLAEEHSRGSTLIMVLTGLPAPWTRMAATLDRPRWALRRAAMAVPIKLMSTKR